MTPQQQIKTELERQRKSGYWLAEQTDLSSHQVHTVLHNKGCNVKTIIKMAQALNMEIIYVPKVVPDIEFEQLNG